MISFLFVDAELVWRGGQDQLFTLLRGLIRRGHSVHLACHPGTLLETRCQESGVVVHPIRVRTWLRLFTFWRLLRLLRRTRPEVLAFNTPKPILAGTIASHLAGRPVRIIFRRVSFPLRRNLISRLKYNWGIDCIVAISESIAQQLRAAHVPQGKIRIVYEGIDPSVFTQRTLPPGRPAGTPCVVGTVAHLSREKGHAYLVRAAAEIPDARSRMRFLIVGEGAELANLKSLVHGLGLEGCFEFTGFQADTIPFLLRFDIFVMPSLSEGLSSAILAAMAVGLPVVATNVGGIPELVQHGSNGLLVPPADAGALAGAVRSLADDPALAARMGACGRRILEERFTLERKIAATELLCRELLAARGAAAEATHA